jgi:hypothetical protein
MWEIEDKAITSLISINIKHIKLANKPPKELTINRKKEPFKTKYFIFLIKITSK